MQIREILFLRPLPSPEPGHILRSEQMPSIIQVKGANQIPSTSFEEWLFPPGKLEALP